METKLHYTTKKVDDLLVEKAVMRSCVFDVTGLLSDIIETRNHMISLTVKRHLADKLRPVFVILHRLEGISKMMSYPKQGGEKKIYSKFKPMKTPRLQLNLQSSSNN